MHQAQADLEAALRSRPDVLALWEGLTPLGRDEFICRVDDAKRPATRRRRIERTREELTEGKKRPCCWPGCVHRDDKAPGRWQQAVLVEGGGRAGLRRVEGCGRDLPYPTRRSRAVGPS